MKMESPVTSPVAGVVRQVFTAEKRAVNPGAPLFAVEPA
jgi:biotin carboxyl carrier protein